MKEEALYLQQYKRMKRYYARFEKINSGHQHEEDSDNYHDQAYSFFIHCYHLKDWIKNDNENGITKDQVEAFVQENHCLKICGDICNGVKHLALDRPRVGSGAQIVGRDYRLSLGEDVPFLKIKYRIDVDGEVFDGFTIATDCVYLWDRFISEHSQPEK